MLDKKNDNTFPIKESIEDGSGEGGGGSKGQIEFRDFLASAENRRDDLLSPEEMRRLLLIHKETHLAAVKKQKELKEHRQAVKEGKVSVENYRLGLQGTGTGGLSPYKPNPRLNKAQFSGIDSKVTPLPIDNIAETNQEKKQELVYRNELKNRPQEAPRFNPKPIPR